MSETYGPYSMEQSDRVFGILNEFFHRYLEQRDAKQCLSLLSEQVCSIGTGEEEIAIGREAFEQILLRELEQLPGPIHYRITDYVQHEKLPGCWDCFCRVETRMDLPDGSMAFCNMRVTAGIHQQENRLIIDMLHASEPSDGQRLGEFFPLRSISQGNQSISRETQHELMELIGQMMPGGIVGGYMEKGYPLYVANDRFLSMGGYGSYEEFEQDIKGMVINTIHPEDWEYVENEIDRSFRQADQYEIEYRMRRRDGSYIWVHDAGRLTRDFNGRKAIVSVLTDISKQVCIRQSLEYAAVRDPLTGIYNRKGGQTHIAEKMRTASDYLFFMMDLDNFKQVNDFYGHDQGDQVLKMFGEQLMSAFRKTDTVCRLGGDEFAVFVTDCGDIQVLLGKVQKLIESYRTMMQAHWPAVQATLSVGAVYGRKYRSFEQIYQLADAALYEVKNTGKGRLKLRTMDH